MHVLDVNEIFGITFYTYDRIMELGGKIGPDAYALYTKLVKQSRIQQTNQTKSLNAFLKEGLGRGDDRLKNAKKILKQLGLIDDIDVRDEQGKIRGHYVRVNFLINESKVRNACITYNLSTKGFDHDVDLPTSGGTDTNALSIKYINAGSSNNTGNSSLNSESRAGELDVCARVQTYADIQEVIEDDSYRVNNNKLLKCIVKMCELGYQVDKKEKAIKELVNRIKEKAEIYNIKNADGSIAQGTMLQIFDQWLEYYNGNGKKVSNHKTSVMRFMINHNKPYKKK